MGASSLIFFADEAALSPSPSPSAVLTICFFLSFLREGAEAIFRFLVAVFGIEKSLGGRGGRLSTTGVSFIVRLALVVDWDLVRLGEGKEGCMINAVELKYWIRQSETLGGGEMGNLYVVFRGKWKLKSQEAQEA